MNSDLNKFLTKFSGLTKEIKHNLYSEEVVEEKHFYVEPIEEFPLILEEDFIVDKIQQEPTIVEEFLPEELYEEISQVDIVSELLHETLKPDLTEASQYDKLFKTNVNVFGQPNLPKVNPELKAITDKVKYMEDWLTKISMAGPGGGEVNLRWLDDIDRTTIANDRYLKFDQHSNKFVFSNPNASELGTLDYIQLNLAGPTEQMLPGSLSWNPDEDCLNVTQNDGSTLQVGLENYIQVKNNTGSPMSNGDVVRFGGVGGETPLCALMEADSTSDPLYIIGVLTNEIPVGSTGRATILGKVHDLNTTGSNVGESWNVGDLLWVHPSQPGKLTKVKPTVPQVAISVAAVIVKDATAGVLLVRPTIWPRLRYGTFSNTVDHIPDQINTPIPIALDTTLMASGFSVANSHHITATTSGLYNFNMSVQLSSTNSSSKNVYFWIRKNDQDVNYSTRSVTVNGNNTQATFCSNWTVSMNVGDDVQMMYAVTDLTIRLDSMANTSFAPSTPSVLLTVTQAAL